MTTDSPTVTAVIPARGGSQGVPRKNLRRVGGVTLLGRAIRVCRQAESIDEVAVSTDDEEIAAEAALHGATVIERPDELASHAATSESALLHALDQLGEAGQQGVLAFLQCTSPFIDPAALDSAVAAVVDGRADCAFAAIETYEFLWRTDESGATGINHDHSFRPRRQDREPHWRETGAFYVMDIEGFRKHRFRFFGRVRVEPVPAATAIEIDDEAELRMAQSLARQSGPGPITRPQALITDFDGVHTDDRALVDQHGTETVRVNRSDGHGIKLLRRAGVPVLILSTETNPVVAARARKLGVDVIQGVDDKWPVLEQWLADHGIRADDVAYVGNDINDRECLQRVGTAIVPADAHPAVMSDAHVVTDAVGGAGVVREVADLILGNPTGRSR